MIVSGNGASIEVTREGKIVITTEKGIFDQDGNAIAPLGVKATNTIKFNGNPANNETYVFNGLTVTFKDSPGAFPEVQRGATLSATLDNLETAMNAATDEELTLATYEKIGDDGYFKVTAIAPGTTGDNYTLAAGTAAVTTPASLSGGEEKPHTPGVRVVANAATDRISAADNDGIVFYTGGSACDVTFSTDIGLGFNCIVINHPSGDIVNFDTGQCQSANGFYSAKNGGIVRVVCPDAVTMYLSGDLKQESTLFADLPASPSVGDLAVVSDSNTFAPGDSIAGGGAETVLAYFSTASGWRVAGGQI